MSKHDDNGSALVARLFRALQRVAEELEGIDEDEMTRAERNIYLIVHDAIDTED
jgi:hypothetical protein